MKTYSKAFLLNSTPSRLDGVTSVKETQLRKTYCNFIKQLVKELKLLVWTLETATVFTHRFFAVRSHSKNDRFLIATASVLLACKVDESLRTPRDLAYVMLKTKWASKPEELHRLRTNTDEVLKPHIENLLLAERALLYTLAFDLQVDHPYTHLVNNLGKLGITVDKVQEAEAKRYFQLTQNMLNDSLPTTLCLQYTPAKLAAAAMYQVATLAKYKLPLLPTTDFTQYFDVSQDELDGELGGSSQHQQQQVQGLAPKPATTGVV